MTYTFGVDKTGLSFGGSPLSPGSSFGSIPTYANNASSVKPLGLTGGMDPLTAVLGVAGLGTSIAGMFGAKSQADQAREAAEDAAEAQKKAVQQASELGAGLQLAQVYSNLLEDRYKFGTGSFGDDWRDLRKEGAFANFQATNPALMAARSVERYDRNLKEAMGRVDPTVLFS